jgi:hypothetical protein
MKCIRVLKEKGAINKLSNIAKYREYQSIIIAEIDISDLTISQELAEIYGNKNMRPGAVIKKTLNNLITEIEKDESLLKRAHAILIERLKYATGNLYNSIGIYCTYTYKETSGTVGKLNYGSCKIFVKFAVKPELINALFGEDEAKTPVPDVGELVKWIRGKQQYFRDRIASIEKKKEIQRALQRQRRILLNRKSRRRKPVEIGINPITTDTYSGEQYLDPIHELASQIRQAMTKRFKTKDSATKGSEYVFIGYRRSVNKSMFSDNPIESLVPKYIKEPEPLLVMKGDGGYLLKELAIAAEEHIANVFKKLDIDIIQSGKQTIDKMFADAGSDRHQEGIPIKDFDEGLNNLINICNMLRRFKGKTAKAYYKEYMSMLDQAQYKAVERLTKTKKQEQAKIEKEMAELAKKFKEVSMSNIRGRARRHLKRR